MVDVWVNWSFLSFLSFKKKLFKLFLCYPFVSVRDNIGKAVEITVVTLNWYMTQKKG